MVCPTLSVAIVRKWARFPPSLGRFCGQAACARRVRARIVLEQARVKASAAWIGVSCRASGREVAVPPMIRRMAVEQRPCLVLLHPSHQLGRNRGAIGPTHLISAALFCCAAGLLVRQGGVGPAKSARRWPSAWAHRLECFRRAQHAPAPGTSRAGPPPARGRAGCSRAAGRKRTPPAGAVWPKVVACPGLAQSSQGLAGSEKPGTGVRVPLHEIYDLRGSPAAWKKWARPRPGRAGRSPIYMGGPQGSGRVPSRADALQVASVATWGLNHGRRSGRPKRCQPRLRRRSPTIPAASSPSAAGSGSRTGGPGTSGAPV